MEGLSGEGTRRRREYTEDTEIREPTIEDIERAKERALEKIDASRESEVSAREYVHQALREVLEEEKNEKKISHELKEAIEDLEREEEFRESIERRKEEVLEKIDLSRREVVEDSLEKQEETGESRFEDIRSQEERDAEIARKLDEALEELEKMERPEVSEPKEVEEGDISGKVKDAIEDLERLERVNESTEDKSRDALESIDEQEGGQEGKILADEATENTEKLERSEDNEETTASEIEKRLEKRDEKSLTREAPSRIQELDQSWIKDVISDEDSKEWNKESLVEDLRKISHNLPDTSSMFYIDVEKSLGVSSENLGSFEQAFHEARESFDEIEGVRFGLAGERLYVWKPEFDSASLENAYDSLYYYFRDKEAFDKYIDDVGDALGFQGKNETLKHLRELVPQMVVEDSCDNCINSRIRRIRGDHINLMNDISGKDLSDLECEIAKISGPNGHGGIEKPLYPRGEALEVAAARITAAVLSDGTIEPNGVIKYAEPNMNRIERVIENVRVFGDINPSSKLIEGENHYITHLPFVVGKILMSREVPSGDRTIQNPRLSSSIREGTDEAKRAYIEDFTPQDACVGQKTIIWRRVNALHAGEKTEKYGFQSRIESAESDLIKDYGRKASGKANSWALSWGKLRKLADYSDENVSCAAKNLQQAIQENPNRLMNDEVTILREMGIGIGVRPSDVRYYPGTGRVSVVWQAYTTGAKEAIKLGIVTCPNDVNNREKVRKMITNYSRETEKAIADLRNNGIEFKKWWKSK
jgi:hypothetical protein